MSARQLNKELRIKTKIEKEFIKKLKIINKKIARSVTSTLFNSAGLFNSLTMADELTGLLLRFYKKTDGQFEGIFYEKLPKSLQITGEELNKLNESKDKYFNDRSSSQSLLILLTTNNQIFDSVELAKKQAEEQARQDKPTSNRATALIAGALVLNKLNARNRSIARFEIGNAAESVKSAEADVLTGNDPYISTKRPPQNNPVIKTWITKGDQKVRKDPFSHVSADFQEQPTTKPFIVGGQQLMYPGDTSLGASIANVIECRCISFIDVDQIKAIRIRQGKDPEIATELDDQLTESIGNLI